MTLKLLLVFWFTLAQETIVIITRIRRATTTSVMPTSTQSSEALIATHSIFQNSPALKEEEPIQEEKPTTGLAIFLITAGFLMLIGAMVILIFRFRKRKEKVEVLNIVKPLPSIPDPLYSRF